jgi:predicted dehydrogenase/nucleoside-diphosphate-sugar epimerase
MKTAIVGCGHIASAHIPYILKIEGVQLVAMCDRNEIRGRDLAQQNGTPHYTDFAKMLADAQPDVVHILTPPQTHAALTIQALHAGCHVLVEKPLCLTLDEADAIHAAAQSSGRRISVDHTHLWSPLVQKARRLVASGQVGKVLNIHYVMGDDYLEMVKGGYARWALDLRGGVFCDLIPHPLYLILAFLPGAQIVSVQACGTGIHDLHELWVTFAVGGTQASLWMSLNQRPLEHSLRIHGTHGALHIDLRNFNLAVMPERGLPGPAARVVNTLSESWQRAMGTLGSMLGLLTGRFDPHAGTAGAIRAFYQAIIEDKPAPITWAEANAPVELAVAIWERLETTSGCIRPARDSEGQVIVHKTVADLATGDQSATILVTGGTGFIGSHLVRRLVSEGRSVRVFCRKHSNLDALPIKGVEVAFGDLSDFDAVCRAMQGIEVLYHLGATMGGDWAEYQRGTVDGTKYVLQAAVRAGVRKVIHVSSLGVLDACHFPNGKAMDESFPVEPQPEARGYYSRAKLQAEIIAREFAHEGKLALCIVRPGLVYGPGKSGFLSDAGFRVSNGLVLVVGMGIRRLGLSYVENLVDALLGAELSECSMGKTYHIVDPDQPTVHQYIKTYRQKTGKRLTALYIPAVMWTVGFYLLDGLLRLVRGSSPHLGYRLRSIARGPRYDTSAAKEQLGWNACVTFEEGMKKTYEPRGVK